MTVFDHLAKDIIPLIYIYLFVLVVTMEGLCSKMGADKGEEMKQVQNSKLHKEASL